jgi:antitoxin (DNA-binding transcriptional repressor) of toxin-antitoxin stability system
MTATMRINVDEAQLRLWELIEAAQAGEEIVIVDIDGQAARLVPIDLKGSAEPAETSET